MFQAMLLKVFNYGMGCDLWRLRVWIHSDKRGSEVPG